MKVTIKVPGTRKVKLIAPNGSLQVLTVSYQKRKVYIGRLPVQVFQEGAAPELEQRVTDLEIEKINKGASLGGRYI